MSIGLKGNVDGSGAIQVGGSDAITISTGLDTTHLGASLSVGAMGYTTGAGGTVTQATSKATAVTLNKLTGQITTAADALAAGVTVAFVVNNSLSVAGDVVVVNSNSGSYTAICGYVTTGSFAIRLTNVTAGSLSTAVAISFAIIKGVTS